MQSQLAQPSEPCWQAVAAGLEEWAESAEVEFFLVVLSEALLKLSCLTETTRSLWLFNTVCWQTKKCSGTWDHILGNGLVSEWKRKLSSVFDWGEIGKWNHSGKATGSKIEIIYVLVWIYAVHQFWLRWASLTAEKHAEVCSGVAWGSFYRKTGCSA